MVPIRLLEPTQHAIVKSSEARKDVDSAPPSLASEYALQFLSKVLKHRQSGHYYA